MKLVEAKSNTCSLCMIDPIDPEREDNLCIECGAIVDKYNQVSDEKYEYLEADDDCGCA